MYTITSNHKYCTHIEQYGEVQDLQMSLDFVFFEKSFFFLPNPIKSLRNFRSPLELPLTNLLDMYLQKLQSAGVTIG